MACVTALIIGLGVTVAAAAPRVDMPSRSSRPGRWAGASSSPGSWSRSRGAVGGLPARAALDQLHAALTGEVRRQSARSTQ